MISFNVNFYIHPSIGQLLVEERMFLYSVVRVAQPVVSVEVGTWRGAGSTYIIAAAMRDNCDQYTRSGTLYTVERDKEMFDEAVNRYETEEPFRHLNEYVTFALGDGTEFVKRFEPVDFAFLDGANDPDESMEQVHILESRMMHGCCVLAMHDYGGEKMRYVRSYLPSSPRWRYINRIHDLAVFTRTEAI